MAHIALVAGLYYNVQDDPTPLPIPERMTVSLADQVSLESTAPDAVPEVQAAVAPVLAPEPAPVIEPVQEPVVAPQPKPTVRPTPTPRADGKPEANAKGLTEADPHTDSPSFSEAERIRQANADPFGPPHNGSDAGQSWRWQPARL